MGVLNQCRIVVVDVHICVERLSVVWKAFPSFVFGLHHGQLTLLLFLQKTVDLEPIGPSSVSGAALRHPNHEAFPQSASLARRPVLFGDDAFSVILTLGDGAEVVISAAEERLKQIVECIRKIVFLNQFTFHNLNFKLICKLW